MGSSLSKPTVHSLTDDDIEALQRCVPDCPYDAADIKSLYERFVRLDRSGSGTLTREELVNVPEFAMNPLAGRILDAIFARRADITLTDFVAFLSTFHPETSVERKLRFAFQVLAPSSDTLRRDQLIATIRLMAGPSLSEAQVEHLAALESLPHDGLGFEDFSATYQEVVSARLSLRVP